MKPLYDNCELTVVERKESDWLRVRNYMKFTAQTNGKIIAETEEIEIGSGSQKWLDAFHQLYKKMLQTQLSDGWEVVSTNEVGIVLWMRKAVKNSGDTQESNVKDDALVQAAWILRKANMLTSDEFEAVMNRLHSRR
jgi:hypothetical protein